MIIHVWCHCINSQRSFEKYPRVFCLHNRSQCGPEQHWLQRTFTERKRKRKKKQFLKIFSFVFHKREKNLTWVRYVIGRVNDDRNFIVWCTIPLNPFKQPQGWTMTIFTIPCNTLSVVGH